MATEPLLAFGMRPSLAANGAGPPAPKGSRGKVHLENVRTPRAVPAVHGQAPRPLADLMTRDGRKDILPVIAMGPQGEPREFLLASSTPEGRAIIKRTEDAAAAAKKAWRFGK